MIVIGIAQWKNKYKTLEDAAGCVRTLSDKIATEGTRLDFIEVMVEFATGESDRCAFKTADCVFAWVQRFE